jgi:prepilin-type N-terminal cleavage/methylation domain-containing protein
MTGKHFKIKPVEAGHRARPGKTEPVFERYIPTGFSGSMTGFRFYWPVLQPGLSRQNPFVPSRLCENLPFRRRGYTLVEMLISLALLAVLFSLLGSMLHGMSRISRLAEDSSVRDREMSFCMDLMRKELGEMILDQKKVDFNFISGDNFMAYTTTRNELLARDSIPGGVKRIEWRYDPALKCLKRTVSTLIDGKRDLAARVETAFLDTLEGFEVYYFNGVDWIKMTGISELVPDCTSICVRFVFPSENRDKQFFETAFILPNEKFSSK